MEIAKLQITGTTARIVSRKPIPAGMIGGYITVEYTDPLWLDLTRTVVFQGAVTRIVVTSGNTVQIPAEVIEVGKRLRVGFFGTQEDGTLAIPTFWADLGIAAEAAEPSGDESTDPSLPVWAQLAARIEALEKNDEGNSDDSGGYGADAVLCTKQTLTDEQKTQARENIGAVGEEEALYIGIDETGNVFDSTKVIAGYEVYNDGRIIKESNSAVSDYIRVRGHETLYINNLPIFSGNNRFYAFYDAEKNVVSSGKTIDKGTKTATISIPSNAYYLVFTVYQRWKSGSKDYTTTVVSFNGIQGYTPVRTSVTDAQGNAFSYRKPTYGRKMLIFGDSITETSSMDDNGGNYEEGVRVNWPKYICAYLEIFNFKNYAKSGATYKDNGSSTYRQNVSEQIALAMADSSNDDAAIVVVSLGTNDGAASIGDYDTAMSKATLEELDRTNLYEALRWSMWTLRSKYEGAVFFAGLPIQRAANEQPDEMLEAIRKMANRYNFIVIDATNESGIIREFETSGESGRYLYDGLHPNAEGSMRIAKLYANTILSHFLAEQ